jgi:hypothetical protein
MCTAARRNNRRCMSRDVCRNWRRRFHRVEPGCRTL